VGNLFKPIDRQKQIIERKGIPEAPSQINERKKISEAPSVDRVNGNRSGKNILNQKP
jgi:hypothetical protein